MNMRAALRYLTAVAALVVVPAVALPLHDLIQGKPGTVAFAQIIVVLVIATHWGTGPALAASLAGVLAWDYWFLPPYYSFKIGNLSVEDTALLTAFLVASVLVGQLSARAQNRAIQAEEGRKEIERLCAELQRENEARRQAEAALRSSQEALELRVSERTRELQDAVAQLERARSALAQRSNELARSNADLEQFAYAASHDLQEPLRMVGSFVQLLEERYRDRLDPDAHEFIGYAVDGTKRMQMLITDLLAYSRVSTKAASFHPIDCEAILATVTENLRVVIAESSASITHGPLPTLAGDASQLTQVLQNLIANAVKFRGSKTPEVRVSAVPEPGRWCFCVRDNGIGIEPEYHERIFVLFKRLHSRSSYPGTGIGLAICKKVVERHGGRMWVESSPGDGSAFYFTLPREED